MLDPQPIAALEGAKKPLLTGMGVALFLYFFALPLAWQPPEIQAALPESWPMGQDLAFTVRLTALHGNFDVASIRFYVDHYASTAKGPEGLFYPAVVFEQRPRAIRNGWSVNRLTYPRTRDFNVTVPLSEYARQGLVGPGVLAGKVDVTSVSYEPSGGRHFPGVDRMRQGMKSVNFSIVIHE